MSQIINLKSSTIITLCLFTRVYAQDVAFSQPYAAPLYLNPAYSGVAEHSRIGVNFQHRWGQLGAPYMAYSLYADHYFADFKSGVGFMALSDRQPEGAFVQNYFGTSYSYNLRMAEKTFVRFGLQALLGVTSTNPDKLIFPDMVDGYGSSVPSGTPYAAEQKTYFDMGVGSVFSHHIFYAGAAVHHLMGSPQRRLLGQDIGVARKLTLHGGCNIPVGARNDGYGYSGEPSSELTISPNVIFSLQDVNKSYAVGVYFNKKFFSAGLFYKSEFSAVVNFYVLCAGYTSDLWSIMYSYDVGRLSKEAKAYTPDVHEVSLTFKIKKRERDTFRLRWESSYKVLNAPLL